MPELVLWALATIGAVTLSTLVALALARVIRIGQGPRDDNWVAFDDDFDENGRVWIKKPDDD